MKKEYMHDVLENLKKLPAECIATTPTGEAVLIKRGIMGYFGFKEKPTKHHVKYFNESMGATPEKIEAMLVGSMFGWHVPACNPDFYDSDGSLNKDKLQEAGVF